MRDQRTRRQTPHAIETTDRVDAPADAQIRALAAALGRAAARRLFAEAIAAEQTKSPTMSTDAAAEHGR